MNKHIKIILCLLTLLVAIFILLNPYIDTIRYKKYYTSSPDSHTLFNLCNVSAYCYDYGDFYIYSKEFFDNYNVEEIQKIYDDISVTEANNIFDVFLAEFLVKSVCQGHINQKEFNKYIFMYSDPGYFVKALVDCVDKYCLLDKNKEAFLGFLNSSLELSNNYTQKMMIYTVQVYLYDDLDDAVALATAMDNQESIRNEYYEEKTKTNQ